MTLLSNRRVAAIGALLLLAGAGVFFRYIEEDSADPIKRGPARELADFPNLIGPWKGEALHVDDQVIAATDTDAYVSRIFRGPTAPGSVGLYVGCGVRSRDLVPHRPSVCYPGAGWTLAKERSTQFAADSGDQVDCRIYRFERGGLDSRAITVLNYYLIDGSLYPDVEYLRSKGWGRGNIGYVAQIQITSAESSPSVAEAAVVDFAKRAAGAIREITGREAAAAAATKGS